MYILRAEVIPCKGFKRTALVDIVNSEIAILDSKYFETLYELYNFGINKLDNDLLSILESNNYLLQVDDIKKFPRISITKPLTSLFLLENCIIDRNAQSSYDIIEILKQLDNLNCKYVQFRFFEYSEDIYEVINYLNSTMSFIQNIEIIIENSNKHFQQLQTLFIENLRINKLILFGSKKTGVLLSEQGRILFETQDRINDCRSCGMISMNSFFINKYHVKDANTVNTCLFKKISIDTNGYIKNCPSMSQSFGNIKDTTLEEVLSFFDFKKYWNLTKDQIETCKDCEFRYICTDCRAYTERTNTNDDGLDISKPLKCGYNPYSGEWVEWSASPLKQKAIKYYGIN